MTMSAEESMQHGQDESPATAAPHDVQASQSPPPAARDAAYWAQPVDRLHATGDLPADAINLNLEGRRLAGVTGGFGKMWQKTYRTVLDGSDVTPAQVIKTWKENFQSFWPKGNRFYGSLTSISPGDVALLNLTMPGRMKLSTGILVIYADDESFSFMNPEGHMFAGMITFSSFTEDGRTVVQVQVLIRAGDPVYEIAMTFGGHRMEDRFWKQTVSNVATHFGVTPEVEMRKQCVDRRRQWGRAGNVTRNAAIRSGVYMATSPVRWAARPLRRAPRDG